MTPNYLLYFAWVDVKTARYDHVALAIYNVYKSVCVFPTDVPGQMPTIRACYFSGGFCVVVVPLHNKATPHRDFPCLSRRPDAAVTIQNFGGC